MKREGLCATKYCRRRHRKNRKFCHTCRSRKWRAANPIRYLFNNLRQHAKERGHGFTLIFEQWKAFCLRTEYHKKKGIEPHNLTVERIDELRGYHADNIKALRHDENIRREFAPAAARVRSSSGARAGTIDPDDGQW